MDTFFTFPVYIILFLTMYFEVFLLVTYFEEKEHFGESTLSDRMPGKYPTVTVIVPAWNEGETILGTVNSLLDLDYPRDRLSIFIVDDGSTDNTLEIAKRFVNNPQVRVFANSKNGGKYSAVNLGLSHATADLVGCLDADSFVAKDALKEIIPFFDDSEIMAVTPSVQIHDPNNPLRKLQATEYMIGEFTRKVFSRINALYVTPGPFSIYRRFVFKKIGGFVHGYGTEDMEMAMRMQSHHMKIENAHNALVYTVSPANPYALYKQRVRWVSGFLKNAFFKYRFMFLNRKYGNLGILTLPFAFTSIFIALFFTVMYVKNLFQLGYERYLQYSALGFHPHFTWHQLDWFSFNLEFRRLIIYCLFFTTIFFVLMGTRMVLKKIVLSRGMIYFLLFYGLIAPFWLARSLYNLLTAKEARWR